MNSISISLASTLVQKHFSLKGELSPLVGYEDINYKLHADVASFVVKFSKESLRENIETQTLVMQTLADSDSSNIYPNLIRSKQGNLLENVEVEGNSYILRVIPWLEGTIYAESERSDSLHTSLGQTLANMDKVLFESGIWYRGKTDSTWDIQFADLSKEQLCHIKNDEDRRVVAYFLQQFSLLKPELQAVRKSMIHADVNDYNMLVQGQKISGIIDFGDAVYAPLIDELAVSLAYALMGQEDLLQVSLLVIDAYHCTFALEEKEVDLLYYLIAARLCVCISQAAYSRYRNPENAYLRISEGPALALIHRWIKLSPILFSQQVKKQLGFKVDTDNIENLEASRLDHVNPSLSISYSTPIVMEKAAFQYMYSQDGTTYLDCVNNICHVGHNHPHVVEAAMTQLATLNTNTRYFYKSLNEYASRLASKFPDPLNVVYFVNSGSEAGDLAQRITRTVSGRKETVVVDHAYHGNTLAGIEASPYKYEGKGGMKKADHIFKLPSPDSYSDEEVKNGTFVEQMKEIIRSAGGISAFYCESIIGCGGQIVLPKGYLAGLYEATRQAGGLCIADEVQVGFGRIGEKFWAFELQEVIPDIVVIGKPIGNGHPMAAVVTTKEIADKFNTGMEYFSSFGGNPVSCEIGKAVLDVLEKENLQEHARQTGNYFKTELNLLKAKYPVIQDVRGFGLFLGVELVKDGIPATSYTKDLLEFMKQNGILLSSDGPFNNVIKIKPPMTFNKSNVDSVVSMMDNFLNK